MERPAGSSGLAPDASRSLPLLISVPRAAAILGISRATAYRLAASGDLPCRHIGHRVWIISARLADFVNDTASAA